MPFNVTRDNQEPSGPQDVAVPQSSPIVQPPAVKTLGTNSNASNSSNSDVADAGNIIGGIGKVLGAALLFLSKGGPVGYAEGGYNNANNPDGTVGDGNLEPPSMDPKQALAMGYLVGALHQRDFGGTPDTLEQAAHMIHQKMTNQDTIEPPAGHATGGEVNNDQDTARQALMQSMGLSNENPGQVAQMPDPQTQKQQSIGQQNAMAGGNFNSMRGYATGGAGPQAMQELQMNDSDPMSGDPKANNAPLGSGQPFMGDGSVKGPGGPQDDVIPAKLSNGEFVISAPAVQFFGVDKLNKMNEQGKQGFMQMQTQQPPNQPRSSNPQDAAGAPQGPSMMPQGQPMAPPMGMMQKPEQAQPPMKSGGSVMRAKGSGYMGL